MSIEVFLACKKELDGPFQHTVQVEKGTTKVVLSCHSKARRNKKKKVPLLTSEEVDIDHAINDPDSPILWIRLGRVNLFCWNTASSSKKSSLDKTLIAI